MRNNFVFPVISSLLVLSCSTEAFKAKPISKRTEQSYRIDFGLNPKDFNLTENPLNASVKDVDILCDDKKTVISLSLKPEEQQITLDRDPTGCEYILKTFHVSGLANLPVENPIYSYSQATGATKEGVIFSVFDLKNDKNETLDRKLVTSFVKEVNNDCPDKSCLLTTVEVKFQYSEIKRTDVVLENNLKIQDLKFSMENEPAPLCKVTAQFMQPAGSKPSLEITLSQCTQLFDHKHLLLGVGHHSYKNVYQLKRSTTDSENIVGLHELIDSSQKSVADLSLNGGVYKLVLTLDQLISITKKSSWIAALREDLVLAIRNKDGKSISYFVIDNTCSSDIVDKFQDVIAKNRVATWSLTNPGLQNQSYYKVSGLALSAAKTTGDLHGFCIDTDRSIEMSKQYSGEIFLSYDLDNLYRYKLVERPSAMPAVNWLLNKYLGQPTYTYGEIQKAIWHLVDDKVISNGLGTVDDVKVETLVREARTTGLSYVPTKAGEWVAVVMVPLNNGKLENQATIAVTKIPSDLCVTPLICK